MKNQVVNYFINFFWTILCTMPVITFWVNNHAHLLYIWLLLSVAVAFLPGKIYKYLQLSQNVDFYKKAGVKFIQLLVQDGRYINRAKRSTDATHKLIANRAQALKYLNTISMYERYHLMCLVFWGISMISAIIVQNYYEATLILLANIIYNLCPILLQQYNRLRVMSVLSRKQN